MTLGASQPCLLGQEDAEVSWDGEQIENTSGWSPKIRCEQTTSWLRTKLGVNKNCGRDSTEERTEALKIDISVPSWCTIQNLWASAQQRFGQFCVELHMGQDGHKVIGGLVLTPGEHRSW